MLDRVIKADLHQVIAAIDILSAEPISDNGLDPKLFLKCSLSRTVGVKWSCSEIDIFQKLWY